MAKGFKFIGAFALVGLSLWMYVKIEQDAQQQSAALETHRESIRQNLLNAEGSNQLSNPDLWSPEDKLKAQLLQQKFVREVDARTGAIWFVHQHWKDKAEETQLRVKVKATGELQLNSFFVGKHPLHHHQVFVKLEGEILDSSYVTYPETETLLGQTYDKSIEEIFFSQQQDETLVKAIARAKEENIPFLLAGSTRKEEAFIDPINLSAFRDCYELSLLLKKA